MTRSRILTTLTALIGLLTLTAPAAHAQTNYLIKGSGPAVYYNGDNGKRYVFTTESIYKSWYPDYSSVAQLTDSQLAAIPLGGNVTMRPGAKLVKITTDPRVYAVSRYGVLHWVTSEAIAAQLYGTDWNTKIVDVPDAFFVNYVIGYEIDDASQYVVNAESTVASPGANIRAAGYQPPSAPVVSTGPATNPAMVSVDLSASHAVQNQTVQVNAMVSNSTLPITKIEIHTASDPTPIMTCVNTTTCSTQLFVTTAPMTETYSAIAYDSAGARFEVPTAQRPTLNVAGASANIQMSVSPQSVTVGSRASFNSIYTGTDVVQSHKIYALIPGETTPELWSDCGATSQCAGSTPFYRTTNLYSSVMIGGQTFVSPTVTLATTGGEAPHPTIAVTGHPAAGRIEITVTAPTGETIGQTQIKDGTSMDDATLAFCTTASCSITLQINVPGSVTAFTKVGGKYEPSNTITVTP